MDRSRLAAPVQRPVRPHRGLPAPLRIRQHRAGLQIAGLNQRPERNLGLRLRRLHRLHRRLVERQRGRDPFLGHLDIGRFALDPDEAPPQPPRHRARGPRPEEGIEHHVARIGAGEQHAIQQRLGLLRRVRLDAAALQPFRSAADRQHPVGAHLQLVVQALHRPIVERVARAFALRRPDQRLVRIGEARALEIGHGVRLAPDDVVQDPEPLVLHAGADAEDVVIAADHPERAVVLEDSSRLVEPGAGEAVIGGVALELVPVIVDRVHAAPLGPEQLAAELEVVGRIGEDHVDRLVGQPRHRRDAVVHQDPVEGERRARLPGRAARRDTRLNIHSIWSP